MRPLPKKKTKPSLKETLKMLLPAEIVNRSNSFGDEDLGEEALESSDDSFIYHYQSDIIFLFCNVLFYCFLYNKCIFL